MAQPFPPAGNQHQHTEKPLKVYAEQYLVGQPLPVGAVLDPRPHPDLPPLFSDGVPRVLVPINGWVVLPLTWWVLSSRYSGRVQEVIGPEEFAERFGPSEDPSA